MLEGKLVARLKPLGDDEGHQVLAPSVGYWTDPPHPGELVGPGSRIGTIIRLKQRLALVLPAGTAGRVERPPGQHVRAVEYGEPLFRLVPLAAGATATASSTRADVPAAGCWTVVAPTAGVFYLRSAPESPPFVELGSRIRTGQAIGLIEVMKTFNQIQYGAAGLPDEAEVVEIRCGDGQEVAAGQVLVVVR